MIDKLTEEETRVTVETILLAAIFLSGKYHSVSLAVAQAREGASLIFNPPSGGNK